MFLARVKRRTENALLQLPFKAVYLLRLGLTRPLDGMRSKTTSYRWIYTLAKRPLPLLRAIFPRWVLTTRSVGRDDRLRQGAASGSDDDLADIHVAGLVDGEFNRAGGRIRRNRDRAELAHRIPASGTRNALGQLGNS